IVWTSTNTGTDANSSTSQSVSIFLASPEAWTGNQSMSSPSAMPSAAAITPIASIWRSWLRLSREAVVPSAAISSSPQNPWERHPMVDERRTVCRSAGAPEIGAPPVPGAGLGGAGRRGIERAREAPVLVRRVGAVVRGGDAEMAAELLGELGGLAVADPVGDLPDGHPARGEELRRLVHPDPGQVVAEGGVADLGVSPLELAPGGRDPAGDLVEREVAAVLVVDDLRGLLEEAGPEADRCRALNGHVTSTRADPQQDDRAGGCARKLARSRSWCQRFT